MSAVLPPDRALCASSPAAADQPEKAAADHSDSPPPPDRLHRHALECVFALLSLREFSAALRVSRSWMGAVGSMRRMDLTVERPTAPVAELARSLMGRHVASLRSVRIDSAILSTLADRMAYLRELHCVLAMPPPNEPLTFPAQLQRLLVDLTAPPHRDAAQVSGAIAAIGRLALLEELTLWLPKVNPLISFAPLSALSRLRVLSLNSWQKVKLSDAQADQLRTLTRLQKLDVVMTTELLRQLLRSPHDLQWQQISLPSPFDDETAALLPQLPTLTTINSQMSCSRFDWLRGLPNLTDVSLSFDANGNEGRAESLVAGLQQCTNIEVLTLASCTDMIAAQLADLLPRLPRLHKLTLIGLSINSLAFLAQPPLTLQLRQLDLYNCIWLPPAELRHVHTLRGLTDLVVYDSFTSQLGAHDQSLLTPPSAILPLLESFVCASSMPPPVAAADN